jgi:hypothetical protein
MASRDQQGRQDDMDTEMLAPPSMESTTIASDAASPAPKSSVANGNTAKSSTLSRRQQAAHRARIVAVSTEGRRPSFYITQSQTIDILYFSK